MADKIFIIKDQGKGQVTEVPVENLVELGGNSSSSGGITGDYIPLSGTEEGKPVTGPIEIYDEENDVTSVYNGFQFSTNGAYFHEYTDGYNNFLRIRAENSELVNEIQILLPETQGYTHHIMFPSKDSSSDRTSFVLDQDAISYSTEETKTGGTWIDGKPIYRKVIQIADFGNTSQFVYDYDADIMLISAKTLLNSLDIPNTYIQEHHRDTTSDYSGSTLSTEISYDTKQLYIFYTTFTEGEWVVNFTNHTGYIIIEYTKTTD